MDRLLPLFLWLALWSLGILRWLREKLAEGDFIICIVCINTALLLLLLFRFDLSAMIRFLPVTAGAFLRRALSEADWVELIAILIDNAIEAVAPGDAVYVRAVEEVDGFRFSVPNPHGALSNMEFIQMFRRGWSTKRESGHGYGLYNVRQIVERHGGKIITGNEELNGISYITIGVLVK